MSVKADFRQHFIYAGMFSHTSYTAAQKKVQMWFSKYSSAAVQKDTDTKKRYEWKETAGVK